MENLRRTRKPQQLAPAPRRPLRAHSRRRNRCQSPRLECCIDRVAPPSAALLHLSRGGSSRPGRSQTVGPPECDSGRRRGRRGDSASASKSGSIRAEHRDAGSCCGRVGAARVPAAMRRPLPLGKRQPGDRGRGRPSVPSVPTQDVIVLARNRRPANWRHCRDRRAAAVTNAATGQVLFAKGIASSDDLGAIATATARKPSRSAPTARRAAPRLRIHGPPIDWAAPLPAPLSASGLGTGLAHRFSFGPAGRRGRRRRSAVGLRRSASAGVSARCYDRPLAR